MTKPDAGIGLDLEPAAAGAPPPPSIAEIFQAHYAGVARLAAMLGADDPEDVAQEAFARLYRRQDALRDPYAEIAKVMGVSVGTVKAALSRGTGALARELEGKLS